MQHKNQIVKQKNEVRNVFGKNFPKAWKTWVVKMQSEKTVDKQQKSRGRVGCKDQKKKKTKGMDNKM